MSKFLEVKGRTVEEAVEMALEELNIKKEDAEIEILDEGNKGILGLIGNRMATVRVKEKIDYKKQIESFLKPILDKMNIDAHIKIEESNEKVSIQLQGKDVGIVIGRRGETLDALQYLLSLVINKHSKVYKRIELDVLNYRKKREETLIRLAKRLANKVVRTGKDIELEPMNPYERRIIHFTLQNYPSVDTSSIGIEPYRKVVIKYKKEEPYL